MNPASKKNILVLAALGAAALAAASYGAYWWHTGRFMQTTDDAYVGGDISAISSKVSGYIQQLAVQDNMAVKKGDLLIRIDDRDYRAALAKAAGEVAAQQFAVAPTVTLTLGSLPPARLKLASGLFNLMRNLGGAIGIALCGTVLNDRTNLHYSRLADHLNNANLAMSDFVQRSAANFTVQGISPDAAQTAALKNLSALALREARTQAFSDAFYLIMMGFLLAALLVPLMKKPPAH